jgi:hypothetical protein
MDRRLMHEQVVAAVIRGDETETLAAVEPLHLAGLLGASGCYLIRHGSS